MQELTKNMKVVAVVHSQLKNNGDAVAAYADTAGYNRATLLLNVGATEATVDAKLQESDVSGSGYADITGAAITQLAAIDDDKVVAIEVELTGRKRHLKPVVTVSDGTPGAQVCALMILSRADAAPVAIADAGLAERVCV